MTYLLFERRLIGEFETLMEAIAKRLEIAFENPNCYYEIAEAREYRELTLEERVSFFSFSQN